MRTTTGLLYNVQTTAECVPECLAECKTEIMAELGSNHCLNNTKGSVPFAVLGPRVHLVEIKSSSCDVRISSHLTCSQGHYAVTAHDVQLLCCNWRHSPGQSPQL